MLGKGCPCRSSIDQPTTTDSKIVCQPPRRRSCANPASSLSTSSPSPLSDATPPTVFLLHRPRRSRRSLLPPSWLRVSFSGTTLAAVVLVVRLALPCPHCLPPLFLLSQPRLPPVKLQLLALLLLELLRALGLQLRLPRLWVECLQARSLLTLSLEFNCMDSCCVVFHQCQRFKPLLLCGYMSVVCGL